MRQKYIIRKLVAVGLGLALASGCVATGPGYVSGEVVVEGPPPPDIEETIVVSPGVGYVWLPGFYGWVGNRWSWTSGHWERPPRPGAFWHAPHYENHGGHHVWTRGHWH